VIVIAIGIVGFLQTVQRVIDVGDVDRTGRIGRRLLHGHCGFLRLLTSEPTNTRFRFNHFRTDWIINPTTMPRVNTKNTIA
jgi:hypothetical protein